MLRWIAFVLGWYGLYVFSTGLLKTSTTTHPSISIPTEPKRLIIMVVDALRDDFHIPLSMPHHVFQAKAQAPTVTLPRLQSLLHGHVPAFLDAWQYDDSTHFQDNWLSVYLKNHTGVFYGDEVWSKLIPTSLWTRHEYVTSFMATDTVECDVNVTRHLDSELNKPFDIMVLHYLGLDHIGHCCGGIYSPLFHPKLQEYGDVIAKIHAKMLPNDLLVVLGDHGMTNGGSHGGSTAPETSTKAIFIGNYSNIPSSGYQIDLMPIFSHYTSGYISGKNLGYHPYTANMLVNKTNSTDPLEAQSQLITSLAGFDTKRMLQGVVHVTIALFPLMVDVLLDSSLMAAGNRFSLVFKPFQPILSHFIPFVLSHLHVFSTSFIEEQHVLSYFFMALSSRKDLYTLGFIGIMRSFHANGDKYAHIQGWSVYLRDPMVQMALILLALTIYRLHMVHAVAIVLIKAHQLQLLAMPLLVQRLLLLVSLVNPFAFSLCLGNTVNILPLCLYYKLLSHWTPIQRLLGGYMIYFALGHSNHMSSIDISNAFFGVNENMVWNGLFTYVTMFGPTLLSWQGVWMYEFTSILALIRLYLVMLTVFLHRQHLFIWSVFTPRLVMEVGWQVTFFLAFIMSHLNDIVNVPQFLRWYRK